eukprot:CAMPEP_0198215380 /NCGR_PEP_ID=MMETSP1445-20131203/49478_1 /TAXON_ID=36898 /ORGANISM="Pyramimonas sp., Strain CCMP2087" /LENGTH=236 /DNA_ID=CAMNT_0043891079 /DNA_START=18 /DNA_END=728 /DNA_ORIENTATION=+
MSGNRPRSAASTPSTSLKRDPVNNPWDAKRSPVSTQQPRRGGLHLALQKAAELGYTSVNAPCASDSQEEECCRSEEVNRTILEYGHTHRMLTEAQVELFERNEATATHDVSHETLSERAYTVSHYTHTLRTIVSNKERVIARLQQPFNGDWIPLELSGRRPFQELLRTASRDTPSLAVHARQIVKRADGGAQSEPSTWANELRRVPAAVAGCVRVSKAVFELQQGMSAKYPVRDEV